MDLDSLQADLNALRKLYGLLQIDGSGGRTPLSESLDEGSRAFLKKLLDGAAERVFEAHIKIMADNWRSILGTKCLGQLKESKETAKSSGLDQNIKESFSAVLLKDDPPLEAKMLDESASVTSRVRRFATELQGRKKRCLACERGGRLEEANKTQPADKASTQACDLRIPDRGSEAKLSLEPVKSSGLLAKSDFKLSDKESVASPKKEVEDKATKEVYNAIRRIESLIPSLHRLAKPVRAPTGKKTGDPDSFRKTTLALDLDSVVSSSGRDGEVVTRTERTQTRQSKQADQGVEKCYKLTPRLVHPHQRNDYESLKEDEFEEEVNLLKNTVRRTQQIPETHQLLSDTACEQDGGKSTDYKFLEEPLGQIHGKQIQRTSESYGNVAGQIPYHIHGMSILPSQSNEDNVNQYQSCQRDENRRTPTSRSSLLPPSTERVVDVQDSVRRFNQVQYRESDFPEKCPSSRKNTGSKENGYRSPQGNYLPRFSESEETCSDSPDSSSWTTVDATASSSSSPSHTTQTATNCSGESEESGSSSYKDADYDSSKARSFTSQSSSSRYEPSLSSNDLDYGGEDDLDPSEYYQSSHHSVRLRKPGKFRRLKNKLGLIFYHHHHHHHHHHGKSDEAPPRPWKRFGKIFSHVEKKAESKTPTVGTGKKAKHLAKSAPPKQQIGHFHALLDGLMKHIRHSNKPKLGKQRGKKKNVWQNRVKVTNKARAKLQGRDKKHQLVAPKLH